MHEQEGGAGKHGADEEDEQHYLYPGPGALALHLASPAVDQEPVRISWEASGWRVSGYRRSG
jgi:hypothetical protein